MSLQEKDKNIQQEIYEKEKDIFLIIMKYKGWDCVILRHPYFHHLNGYVNIPEGHSLYKTFPSDFPDDLDSLAHGGFTFVNENLNAGLDSIKQGWWIGFDCAHAEDYWPLTPEIKKKQDSLYKLHNMKSCHSSYYYKDIIFVRNNLHEIIDALIEYQEQQLERKEDGQEA